MVTKEIEQEYAWKESYRQVKKEIALLREAIKKKEAAQKAQEAGPQPEEKAFFIERTDKKTKDTLLELQDSFDTTPGDHLLVEF